MDHAVETMFGHCREEMLGRPVEMLLPEFHWEVHVAAPAKRNCTRIKRAAQGGTDFPTDIALRPIVTKQGVHFPFVADLTKKDPRMVH